MTAAPPVGTMHISKLRLIECKFDVMMNSRLAAHQVLPDHAWSTP